MSYMYRQLQHRYVSCGHFDDRHHSQKDGTTHIIHCTLIILTIIQSGQGLFCCSTLDPVFFINVSLLQFLRKLQNLSQCDRARAVSADLAPSIYFVRDRLENDDVEFWEPNPRTRKLIRARSCHTDKRIRFCDKILRKVLRYSFAESLSRGHTAQLCTYPQSSPDPAVIFFSCFVQ